MVFILDDLKKNKKQRLAKEKELRKHLLEKENAEAATGKKPKRSRDKLKEKTLKQPNKKARRLSSEDEAKLMESEDEEESENEST